ncbi:MAG: TRAP transporter large permease subunit [Geminicoccaceae bacterium]|nr:TRAP transporter large permease subunit [Geminicoccaceae bacterium]MDW8370502.1 TRAP transporter large permease subunit [Geminicoccaceae bacterium]
MSIEAITLAMVGALVALLAIGMPMAFALGAVGVGFTLAFYGFDALLLISSRIYGFVTNYVLLSVPMFLLMATIMDRSGVARDLYRAMSVWAGRTPGGVGIMTLVAAVLMAATTGIIGGEVILLGLVALPQMLRLGYDKKLAIGIVCGGGSLGTMIPPSIVLVFYGLTANVSIGDLFLAVVVPGLLLAALYMVYVAGRCWLDPSLGPPLPEAERAMPLSDKLAMLKSLVLPLGIAFSVLGTIYLGLAAVTEAAAMGVLGVLAAAWLRGELSWSMLQDASRQTMAACGLLLWLTFGATALIGVYNLLGGIAYMRQSIGYLPYEPWVVILLMMVILAVMGCFIDWIGVLLLTMPVFVPIVESLGYDKVWFGVLFCLNMQISYLSPPFGPACFYLKGVAPPEISLQEIYAAVWPFIVLQAIAIGLLIAFPDLALWLPRTLQG